MKRSIVLGIGVLAIAVSASAALAGKATLKTFGTCDVTVGVYGTSAIIDLHADSDFGGVYLQSKSNSGKLAGVVFGFTSTRDVAGGAPRFSLPIDDPATAAKGDGYAFMDAANCGGPIVSTELETCPVFYGSGSWANWDAFVAANPTLRITPGAIPLIIADGTEGTHEVKDIVLR